MRDLRLEFWGIRGTVPVWGQDKRRYGGRTLCTFIIPENNDKIIVDAGTGIMELGNKLLDETYPRQMRVHLLLTHFHLDHIMGMPFFPPLYREDVHIIFYSPLGKSETESYLSGLMQGKFFPIDFRNTPAQKEYVQIAKDGFRIGDVQITAHDLNHPQGSVAYKFCYEGKTFVLATDTEHPESGVDEKLAAFCQEADVLVYDAMFTPEEYKERHGWGHSTWLAGTELAAEANVKMLYLSHMNPDHSDSQIDAILESAQKEFPLSYIPDERS